MIHFHPMEVAIQEKESRILKLNICVPSHIVEKEYETVAREFHKVLQLPGFRRGKAPTALIKRRYHHDIMKRTIENIIPKACKEAIEKERLPANFLLSVNDVENNKDGSLNFSATIELTPTVTLPSYKHISLKREKVEVDIEKVVESRLSELCKKHATLVPKEGVVQIGDVVELTLRGGRRLSLYIKEKGVVEEQLLGAKKGERRTIKIDEKEVMDAHIVEIKKIILPKLDDEFAKKIGEFENLSQLREKIKEQIMEEVRLISEQRLREKALELLIKEAKFQIPSTLLVRTKQRILLDKFLALQRARIKITEQEREKMLKEAEKEAERRIKEETLLLAVADAERIEVKDEELIEKFSNMLGRTKEEFLKEMDEQSIDYLKRRERMRKALERIINLANVEEIYA